MEEKYMVNDILEGIKAELTAYQNVITQTQNLQLRQTLQKIRENDESFQYEIFKIAQVKGYYKPAEVVTQKQIEQLKNELEN